MQLDQHQQAGDSSASVIDLTTEPPTRTIAPDGTARPTAATSVRPFGIAAAIGKVIGGEPPIAIECYDGSRIGPDDGATALIVRSPKALQYAVTAPGELGIARAYVSGELDVRGDIFDALALRENLPEVKLEPAEWLELARTARTAGASGRSRRRRKRRALRGRRHSKARDASAIAHHYDVSNDFYRIVLGPSMTYSCAVWPPPDASLETAQATKYELVCRKLGLEPGMRLLDVGCGWGGMAIHAAQHHGVHAVGVTLSRRQAEWARRAVHEAGLDGPRRDPCAGLPRGPRRPVRRGELDRDVRARRRGEARRVLLRRCSRWCVRAAGC